MPNTETVESANHSADKDLPLQEDIRLLGRLLGDTVREQERIKGARVELKA